MKKLFLLIILFISVQSISAQTKYYSKYYPRYYPRYYSSTYYPRYYSSTYYPSTYYSSTYYSSTYYPSTYYSSTYYPKYYPKYSSPEETKRLKESIIWSKGKKDEFIVDEENKTVYFKDKVFKYDHTQEIDNSVITYRNEKQETITYFGDRSKKQGKKYIVIAYDNTKPEIIDLK